MSTKKQKYNLARERLGRNARYGSLETKSKRSTEDLALSLTVGQTRSTYELSVAHN
jgi:hypothetical protein